MRNATAVGHDRERITYFSNGKKILSFSSLENKWNELPSCGHEHFGMAVIEGKLTTVGGVLTNKLKTLSTAGKGWKEVYPAMPTMRSRPAVATTQTHMVVAGGRHASYQRNTDIVEILDIKAQQWSKAKRLPQAVGCPKMVINNSQIYLLSYEGEVYSCSVQKLLKSSATSGRTVWTELADAPYLDMSLAILRGCVLAIGDSDGLSVSNPATTIYYYDRHSSVWRETGKLPKPLYDAMVAVQSSRQMVVVGKREIWQCSGDTYIGSIS